MTTIEDPEHSPNPEHSLTTIFYYTWFVCLSIALPGGAIALGILFRHLLP